VSSHLKRSLCSVLSISVFADRALLAKTKRLISVAVAHVT
jgi:hypothetical protein